MSKLKVFESGDKASLFYNWYFFAILASGLFIVLSLAGNSTIAGILAFLSLGVSARIAYLDKKNADFDEQDHYQDYRRFSKAGLEKRLNPIVAYSLVAFIIDLIVLMSVLPSGFGFSPALFALMFFMALFTCVYLLFFYYTGVTVTINFPTSHGDTVKHDISPVGDTKAVVDTVSEKVDSAVEEVKDDFESAESDVEATDADVEEPETNVEGSESHGEDAGDENDTEPTLEDKNDSEGVLEPSEGVVNDSDNEDTETDNTVSETDDMVSEDDGMVSEDGDTVEELENPVKGGFYKVEPDFDGLREVSENAESADSPEIEETGDSEDSVDSEELSETAENEGNTEIEGTDGNAENEDTPKVDLFGEVEADPKGGD